MGESALTKRPIPIAVFLAAFCFLAVAGRAEELQNTPSILDLLSLSRFGLLPPFAGGERIGTPQPSLSESFVLLNLGQNGLTVKTQYIEKQLGDGLKDLSNQGRTQGQLKTLATSSLLDRLLTAEGELAYSSFDAKSLEGLGEQQHRLLKFGVKGAWSGFVYGAEYRSIGKNFTNLAGPKVATDLKGEELWVQKKFGMLGVKTSLSEFTNNVAQDPASPQITKMEGGTTVSIAPTSWPVLSLFYSKGSLASSKEPDDFRPQSGSLENFGTSLYYQASRWEATLSSTYALTDVSNRPSRVQTDTPLLSLGLTYRPTTAPVEAATFGSYARTKASDGSTNSSAFNLAASLVWNLGQSVAGKKTLSIGTTYNRYLDAVDPSSSQEDFTAWVLLKIASLLRTCSTVSHSFS